ncbi:TRIC cation channel family protein [Ruminococcus sp.]|uniref:trimeric intracellular cation channel family protein n=1 Tax=Ruminococcus sp. TaxID=41978 RepID=UPI0025DE64C1|nr:TRIC cation channel family protein [Ruminococcus sp.]
MNEHFDVIVTILELIGTAAFAASGALTAIKRRFDLFGVIIIGVTTAVGGGIMRDIVIGSHPVAAFRDPLSMTVAAAVSVAIFLALAVNGGFGDRALRLYDTAMLLLDTIGLGIFTVTGITAAMRSGASDNSFLMVFSGVITGVGGGVLRDIFVNKKPEIFVGNIYACASATGAAAFLMTYGTMSFMLACIISLSVTFSLRLLSVKFGWNLPKICIGRTERRIETTKENLINKKGA